MARQKSLKYFVFFVLLFSFVLRLDRSFLKGIKYDLQTYLESFNRPSLVQEVTQLKAYADRKWRPPTDFNAAYDKLLVYPDEIQPSLDSRIIDKICPDADIVILVCSAPANRGQREVIRSTWARGALDQGIAVIFALGSSPDLSLNDRIVKEDGATGDLVVWPFLDTYDNATIKTISGLSWAINACRKAKYIIKTNDDMYIDLDMVRTLLDLETKWTSTILGFQSAEEPKNKAFVPKEIHQGLLDNYIVGHFEIYGRLALQKLLHVTMARFPAFYLEDVFLTGFMAEEAGVTNHRQRSMVRDTWAKGAHERGIFLFFAIGSSLNGSLMDRALQEDGVHSDMVAWPFIDSYDNFTLKVISSLAWVDSACKEATYIIKTDDDMYVDLDLVSSLFVDSEPKWRNTVIGFERYYPTVNRNQSKYHYIPIEVQADLPPQYLVGAFVAYGRQALTSILTLTMTSLPALYIEDTFLTGFMAQEAGVPRWSLKLRYYSENCSYSNSQANKNALIIGDKCTADEMQHLYDIKLTDNFSKISGIQDDVHGTKS
ncbi:Lactosylceramide 1,3-N-acetyl-beta-D-glucosaminyltransferase A [Halotydeus destructor]|nr:Lactosylceramide 1,3-N-acetyl-beta-D-glucosaminyltransferase A [Halotydeus destructor]